jgi:Lrp/AsnC family transcriptional regulator for asnA, asnC and gidA
MEKIDKVDREIVNLVMEDGRMRSAEIARRLGNSSERSVRYRIDRLVSTGVIQISAILNASALGYNVTADVFIEVEPAHIQEVASLLSEYECVSYVACSIGQSDVSIQVRAPNNSEVYSFVTQVVGKLPGVRKTTTSIVPIVVKDVYHWRIPKNHCLDEPGPGGSA